MLRLVSVALLAACSTTRSPASPETSRTPLFLGHALYDAEPEGPQELFETPTDEPALPPVTAAVRADPIAAGCPFAWNELVAPATIRLEPWDLHASNLPDDCPAFDADDVLVHCEPPDCVAGTMARRRSARLVVDGPHGSGRFVALGLVVEDGTSRRFACMTASTVAWRHLHRVAEMLAPLPWLVDVGGDAHSELVVWHRLPWAGAESSNAMVPIVYVLEGNALVRVDTRGIPLAAKLARAYRALVAKSSRDDDIACYRAAAHVLEHWAR